jgi:hypothetical protein
MDRFINRLNIERYRRLASETTNAADRQQIMRLLADEESKFKLDRSADTRRTEARNMLAEDAAGQEQHVPARTAK